MIDIPNSLDTQGSSTDEIPAVNPTEVSNYEETGLSRIAVASVPTKEEEVPEDVKDDSLEEEINTEPIADPIKPFDSEEPEPEPELELESESVLSETAEISAEENSSNKQKSEYPWLDAMYEDEGFREIKRELLVELASDPMNIGLTSSEKGDLHEEMEKIFAEVDRSFLENFYQARKVVPKVLVLDSGDIETVAQEELVSPNLLRMNIYEFTFKDSPTRYRDIGMRYAMCLAASAYESSKILDDKNAAESLFSNFSKEEYLLPLLSNQGINSEQKKSLINYVNKKRRDEQSSLDEETLDKVLEVFLNRADRMHLIRESN